MTKKVLAISLVLCVVFAASSAIARPRGSMRNQDCEFAPEGYNDRFAPEIPKEIRAKMSEAAKLRIDLGDALHDNPIDKAKAVEIHDKIMKLEQDIERWKFGQKIDRIEASRKQHEENRNRRHNSTRPEAPKPETPKPEQESK